MIIIHCKKVNLSDSDKKNIIYQYMKRISNKYENGFHYYDKYINNLEVLKFGNKAYSFTATNAIISHDNRYRFFFINPFNNKYFILDSLSFIYDYNIDEPMTKDIYINLSVSLLDHTLPIAMKLQNKKITLFFIGKKNQKLYLISININGVKILPLTPINLEISLDDMQTESQIISHLGKPLQEINLLNGNKELIYFFVNNENVKYDRLEKCTNIEDIAKYYYFRFTIDSNKNIIEKYGDISILKQNKEYIYSNFKDKEMKSILKK